MKNYRFGSRSKDQQQIKWDQKQQFNSCNLTIATALTPLACFLLLVAIYSPGVSAQTENKNKKLNNNNSNKTNHEILQTNNTSTETSTEAYSSQPARYTSNFFHQAATSSITKPNIHSNLDQKGKSSKNALKKTNRDKRPSNEAIPPDIIYTQLREIIENFQFALNPGDENVLGLTLEEYQQKFVTDYRPRIIGNLYYAANSRVLLRILKSSGHCIMFRPAIIHSGGIYASSENMVMIGFDDNTSDFSIRQFLKNEYFHATTCVRSDGTFHKDVTQALNSDEVNQLQKAIQKGHERLANYEKQFKLYQANPLSFELNQKFQQFLEALDSYEAHIKDSYWTSIQQREYLKEQKGVYKKLGDGRLKFTAGTFTKNGEVSHNDLYVSFKPTIVKGRVFMQLSYLKDNSRIAKAIAFFADFHEYQRQYIEPDGTYFNRSNVMKVHEMASDIAELPVSLQKLIFPEFCNVMNRIAGIDDYCENLESNATCDGASCTLR